MRPDADSPSPSPSATLEALTERLEALQEQGGEHFDPVRFSFLASLTQRLATLPAPPAGTLSKLDNQLSEYQSAFSQAKATLDAAGEAGDDPAQFRPRLRRASQPAGPSPFAPLHRAYSLMTTDDSPEENNTLAGLLKQQEKQVLADNGASAPPLPPKQRELNALRQLRSQRQAQQARQRIDDAITQTPSDAGPLNSHRMVTRAIETLRELSPAYLEHFVNYLDTLMSLEKIAPKR
ncbi:MAG: hypothetical protein AOY29_10720 [Alcanivorax borkumensis]|jgi:hypothetical protein|nr:MULTISPECIES: DUF2894 domain-containing protein [Alcanivorax]OJH08130.1 MAG: hypothetical protein AOY29_10720 [Alcanivorax borkumensis]BAP13093.1 hypothetical protein AS19_02420 [Alcanivorax sp. NBRC 101098]